MRRDHLARQRSDLRYVTLALLYLPIALGGCTDPPGGTEPTDAATRSVDTVTEMREAATASPRPSMATADSPAPTPDPPTARPTGDGAGTATAAPLTAPATAAPDRRVSGELKLWHRITVSFEGPPTSEDADPNPFRDYRLDVTFTHEPSGLSFAVPGYFAADGRAAESGSEAGRIWRAHFVPDAVGVWSYRASFRSGPDVAVDDEPGAGTPTGFDGAGGRFAVGPTDKTGRDLRGKGLLRYVGGHYLQFGGTGEFFLKGGADSPENFLAYYEFDNTVDHGGMGNDLPDGLHHYDPHLGDWRAGDPTWRGGMGKRIIGALNYLAGEGMNSVYFLTMNVKGDGREVYPWTDYDGRDRYDVSKLDQWEIVFEHMDRRGLMLHVVTQEEENDQLLNGGDLGPDRRLYYRELVARFSHHLALIWNLGEESSNTQAQREAFARYIRALDPYDHPIVMHTSPSDRDAHYDSLLGFDAFEGPSLQINNSNYVNENTRRWRKRSAAAGRPWVVMVDETGRPATGLPPDAIDPNHDGFRHRVLWGNLMGGGAGVEWFFGLNFDHNDLDCEDWRSRANMWGHTRRALAFFQVHLPFNEMTPCNELLDNEDAFCLAKPGEVYAIYLKVFEPTNLDLGDSSERFVLRWYNPRGGGPLRDGPWLNTQGPGAVRIGIPPAEPERDWVVLLKRIPPFTPRDRELLPFVGR